MFFDRNEAGRILANELRKHPMLSKVKQNDLLVLSIPRGGVVVGSAIARILGCAHDVAIVKKIGLPSRPELAIGAVAEDGMVFLANQITNNLEQIGNYIEQAIIRTRTQISDYIEKFRQGRPLDLGGKVVILVDDGVATGETMKAAIQWVTSTERINRPQQVIVAVPVCAPSTAKEIQPLVDEFVSLATPEMFWAVGQFYENFNQVEDEEVMALLSQGEVVSSTQLS